MARHNLDTEFTESQNRINLGPRVAVAKAAHAEVRAALKADAVLMSAGLEDALIGSYARATAIWPGKDVDIFGKLTAHTIDSIAPERAYQVFHASLTPRYEGRLTLQPRSIKIAFSPEDGPAPEYLTLKDARADHLFEFSVDVVPAVRMGDRWGIPHRDPERWSSPATVERWVETDPEELTGLTRTRNEYPLVGGQGAYVPTVKAIRQIRKYHLGRGKPGSLFFEFLAYEGFQSGAITGDTWADITASTLNHIARRLPAVAHAPVCDPVLRTPYKPAPEPGDLAVATERFTRLAAQAAEAVEADRCKAGALWRQVFGTNGRSPNDWVFPLPLNCREDGTLRSASTAVNPLRGSDEARGFGSR